MVSLNKSFLYGIGFASVTWAISLYLYWQLTKTTNELSFSPKSLKTYEINDNNIPLFKNSGNIYSHKNAIVSENKFLKKDKLIDKSLVKANGNKFQNSRQLIESLQPVISKKTSEELEELGMVRTEEDERIKQEGFKIHAFNVLISNRLSCNRSIPDTRNELCHDIEYPKDLPSASVIVCFFNEHFETLMRTVHSVLNRTPSNLLKEIILVDDYSDLKDLHSNISSYISKNFKNKVKLFRTDRREGLIRARIFGARKAVGEVLVFLDSHVEVNIDWIQPLLSRIQEDKSNVVMPIIDIINADTFKYTSSPLVRGGFNWGLHFKWENLPVGTLSKPEDFVKPIKSPTMSGGLFAINRQYFIEMGEYDAGMNIWGGENLEISFRIWMCGGRLDLIPCSRVGHVFRQRRPYGDPDGQDTMLYNSLRVANVWMDDYKEYFLQQKPEAKKTKYGDISSRIQLRKELKCKDFDWYLKNVYPELALPTDNKERLKNKWAALEQDVYQPWHSRKRNYVNQFQLRLTNSSLCLQSSKDTKTKGSLLILKSCLRTKQQMWYETDRGELVLAQLLCLQASNPNPILYKCHELGGDQEWKHKGESKTPIYNIAAGRCLSVDKKEGGVVATMRLCSDHSLASWDLVR